MRRVILTTVSLGLLAASAASASTFQRTPIAPAFGLDALTRSVAREQVGRELFSDPYSTVTLGSVDIYDTFPYLESRTFQIVSDPRWNRIVYGEPGQTLRAYDGAGTPLGPLSGPRGLAADERNRVFVADAGNDRVLVLEARTEYGEIELAPLFEITGLSGPFDVAYSDGGTPFVAGDDALLIADTGRNRVVAYALDGTSARKIAELGDLGSGPNHFAGPMAITVGRSNGANTPDVYVADAHSQRLVRLRLERGALRWVDQAPSGADIVTSLDTDRWGNVYAAAPNRGVVRKLAPDLSPVAELKGDLSRPRSFRIPFFTVRDHRTGTVTREGRASGLSVEQWTDASGMRLWSLGLEVPELAMVPGDRPAARFTLTDQAQVTLDLVDAATRRALTHRSLGSLPAGVHTLALDDADLAAASRAGDVVLRVAAASGYPDGGTVVAQRAFHWSGGTFGTPTRALLLGCAPNPVVNSGAIAFVLPGSGGGDATLRLYDSQGRLIRAFDPPFAPGLNQVIWDGRDRHGALAPAGVYFCRLRAAGIEQSQNLVLVR